MLDLMSSSAGVFVASTIAIFYVYAAEILCNYFPNIYIYIQIDNKVIQLEGETYWEAKLILQRFGYHQNYEGWY